MSLKDNANPKVNPLTTYFGLFMSFISMVMFTTPLFIDLKKDIYEMWYIPTAIGTVGLLMLLAPDTLVSLIVKIVVKKTEK